jgi:hypothetical protein
LFLLVSFSKTNEKSAKMSIVRKGGLVSNITFKPCFEHYCIFNFETIPLFFQSGFVEEIEFDNKIKEFVLLKNANEFDFYW